MQRLLRLILIGYIMLAWGWVSAQNEGTAVITTPRDGDQLFGQVLIMGTAAHPSQFDGYILEQSSLQNPDQWIAIQPRVNQQINNGVLGQWDTISVPDGVYQIRLQVFLADGSILEFAVNNVRVVNAAPTSLPTLPSFTQATLAPLPEAGATVTPIIQQPPTSTPRPVEAIPVVDPKSSDGESTFVNFGAIQSAFCSGVYFSMLLFGLIVGYLLVRKQISPYTRRLWWQIRSELDNDRGDY